MMLPLPDTHAARKIDAGASVLTCVQLVPELEDIYTLPEVPLAMKYTPSDEQDIALFGPLKDVQLAPESYDNLA